MGTRSFIFLSRKLLYFFLACVTVWTNFLKCFAVRAVGNALQAQISVINVVSNLIQVSNKAASSVDKEKLLKKYFHREYPYAAVIMCTSNCVSGCFKVTFLESNLFRFFCISSLQVAAEADVLGSCCVRFL